MELEPNSSHTNYGITLVVMGEIEEGVRELETALKIGGSPFNKTNLGYAYGVAGRRSDALKMAEEIKAEQNKAPGSYGLACIYAGLGEKDEALDWLVKAYQARMIFTFPLLIVEPFLANLREEPRFKELAKKMGLGKYQVA
jgi:tetratricopeptide (TPR) repeat protein